MREDKTIICRDCGQEFAWTTSEQDYYESKQLADPVYCLICRGKYEAKKRDMSKYGKKV